MDEETKVRIRRYNRNIEISGAAMIVYGLWNVVKFFLPVVFTGVRFDEYWQFALEDTFVDRAFILFFTIILFLLLFMMHYFLGMAAIRYARGKRKKMIFVFFAILFFLLNLFSLAGYPEELMSISDMDDALDIIASMMVDITLIFILFDMIFSTFMVNWLRKKEVTAA